MAINRRRPIGLPKTGEPLSIVYRNIEELKSNPKNPRRHSKKQIREIARSIETFGFNVPLLVDNKLQLIAGHGRFEASKLLGFPQVPTIPLEHLSETQIKAFEIADNRLAEHAVWDDRLLAEQFKTLAEVKLDFNLEVTGFEVGEIDLMIEDLTPCPASEKDPADQVPKIEHAVPVTRAGDLWLLGHNRLLCGDALDDRAYLVLMDGRRAAAVFTAPPHNGSINANVPESASIRSAEFSTSSSHKMTESDSIEFCSKVFSHLMHCSEDGALHFVCTAWLHVKVALTAGSRVYPALENFCVWVKDTAGPGGLYRSQHEVIVVFRSGTGKRIRKLGAYRRNRSDVWNYPGVSSSPKATEDRNFSTDHPTRHPVALVADAILDSTTRGGIVLDPFLGSGTTLIASERTGRICYAIELNPTSCDLAIRRWQALTGQTAIEERSGRTFSESPGVSRGR
jgi:hypothetical protein